MRSPRPSVVILAGPNGAGKSTAAPELLHGELAITEFVDADDHLFFLWLSSADLAVQRVADRVRSGGHDVPEHTIRRRYQAGLRNLFSLYRS